MAVLFCVGREILLVSSIENQIFNVHHDAVQPVAFSATAERLPAQAAIEVHLNCDGLQYRTYRRGNLAI